MSQYETLGPYQLLKRIAIGGTAEIFLARRSGQLGGFEKFFALKAILPHHQDDEDWRKMLFDEARLCAQIQHDNIVGVHDLAEDDGRLFMVMEYVRGQDLSMVIDALKACNGLMALEVAAYLTRDVCAGLHYAHTRKDNKGQPLGLVHRDISPQNILVGVDGDVKIIDFGVATLRGRGRLETQTGIIKGKLRYMAPEYAVGNQQDARSDIFALGLCFYELITGQPAYDDESLERDVLVEKIRTAEIEPPSSLRQDVPEELQTILMRSLAAHPAERYQSALQMQRALSVYLAKAAPHFTKTHLSTYFERLFEKLDILPEVASNIDPAGADAEAVRADIATDLEIDVNEPRNAGTTDQPNDTASLLTPTGFSRSLRRSNDEAPRARIQTNWSPVIDRSVPEVPKTPKDAGPIAVTLADRIPTEESVVVDEAAYEPEPTEEVPIPEPTRQVQETYAVAAAPAPEQPAVPHASDVSTEANASLTNNAPFPAPPAPLTPFSSSDHFSPDESRAGPAPGYRSSQGSRQEASAPDDISRPRVNSPDAGNISGQFQARPQPKQKEPQMGETIPGRQGLRLVDEWQEKYEAWITTEQGRRQAHLIRIATVSVVFVGLFIWALLMLT